MVTLPLTILRLKPLNYLQFNAYTTNITIQSLARLTVLMLTLLTVQLMLLTILTLKLLTLQYNF